MKNVTSARKMVRNDARSAGQRGAAGPEGVAIASPAYSIEGVDPTASEPAQTQEPQSLQSATWSNGAPIQRKVERSGAASKAFGSRRENRTGLPDKLKAGIETLSGLSMDDVRVHYNSSKPAQMRALAYTQGRNIYVAPGQERHVPHEASHVVQQKQGRVKPSLQLKGVGINLDSALEQEADVMGAKANSLSTVKSRLPSAARVEQSSRLLGRPARTAQHTPTPSGTPVRQFKCFGSSGKTKVDRKSQKFPPGTMELVKDFSEDPKGAEIPENIQDSLNLEPVSSAIVTTYANETGFPREDLATVLYHPKNTTTLYHTTKSEYVPSILESGLDPSFGGKAGAVGTAGEANAPGYIYLANTLTYARIIGKNFYGDYDGELTILKVTVDPDTIFVRDPDLASAVRTTRILDQVEVFMTTTSSESAFNFNKRAEALLSKEDVD